MITQGSKQKLMRCNARLCSHKDTTATRPRLRLRPDPPPPPPPTQQRIVDNF